MKIKVRIRYENDGKIITKKTHWQETNSPTDAIKNALEKILVKTNLSIQKEGDNVNVYKRWKNKENTFLTTLKNVECEIKKTVNLEMLCEENTNE